MGFCRELGEWRVNDDMDFCHSLVDPLRAYVYDMLQ